MDNDAFKIVARLDVPKSVKLIKEDIPKFEGQLQSDKIKIKAELNIAKSKNLIQSQLNTLANQAKAPTIKVGIDTNGLNSVHGVAQNITNSLKTVQTQAQQTASAVVNSVKQQVISVENVIESVKNRWIELYKAENNGNVNRFGLTRFEKSLQDIIPFLERDNNLLKDLYDNISNFGGTRSLQQLTSAIRGIDKEISTFKSVQNEVNKQFQKTIYFETDGAKSTETLYEKFRILTNQLLKYNGISKSISQLGKKDISNTIGSVGLYNDKSIEDFYNFLISNTNKAEAEILQLNQGLQQFNYLLNGLGSFNDSGNGLGIISRSTTHDLNTFSIYLEPMQKFLAGEKQAIAEAQEMDIAYKKLKQTLIETFGESTILQNGNYTVTLEQLKAVVDKAPLAQKYIDNIESRFASLPSVSNQSTQVVDSNMAKVEEQTKETTVAIEKQTIATEKLKAVRESITRDANGQQLGRTSVYGDSSFTRTSHYNENDELTSYTDTENYQKLERELAKIEEVRAKYSRLLADFKSSNSAILSGLTQPIQQFETVLNGLGKASSINDIKIAFESLKQSASEITAYLDTTNSSFNKSTNAINNYKNMDNILKEMATSFDNLVIKPENLKTELDGVKTKFTELQTLEKTEGGYTKAWAEKYREVNLELTQVKTSIELAVKAESSSQKADKNSAYQTQLKYLNKIKEETNTIISLKKKMVNAGDEEKSVYQHEITIAQKRIQDDIQQLEKKKLLTNEAERLVNTYKEEIALQDKINTAKISDKNIQAQSQQLKNYISQIEQAVTKLNSLQNSSTFTKNASNPKVSEIKQELSQITTEYQNLKTQMSGDITPTGLETIGTELTQLSTRFNAAMTTAEQFEAELKSDNSAEKLAQRTALLKAQLTSLEKANPKAVKKFGNEINSLMSTLNNSPDSRAVEEVAKSIQILRKEIVNADKAGKNLWQTFKEKFSKFTGWMSMTYAVTLFTSNVREAVSELQEIDTILTEISKTSDRTEESLRRLGSTSFETASKYGRTASDYLTGVQEMSRAGFGEEESEKMAELSVLAQSAGDMTAELANEYLIATNAGYQLGDSAEKLNSVLDSQNYITNHNALNMSELAEATKIVSSQAAQAGIGIDEMTAALGTMIATTQQGGEVAARAFKGIVMNLQLVEGTAEDIGDGGEDITTESLTKYEKACADLGVSLKEVKDGVLQLRDPMIILEELSNAVSKEAEGSIKVANLISAVGGKYRGNQLSALLQNWETYSKMLSEYNSTEASGSAFDEAMKSAESWEGKLNELSNTWTKFVNGFVNSDFMKGSIDFVTSIIKGADKLIDTLGTLPTILGGVTAVLSAKNVGELQNTPVYAQPQFICA